jgi:large subunit ribosomal protein L35
MPKMKSNRASAKRFKVTGTGKIKREKSYRSHILTKKSAKRKRKLGKATLVSDGDAGRIKRMILAE